MSWIADKDMFFVLTYKKIIHIVLLRNVQHYHDLLIKKKLLIVLQVATLAEIVVYKFTTKARTFFSLVSQRISHSA